MRIVIHLSRFFRRLHRRAIPRVVCTGITMRIDHVQG